MAASQRIRVGLVGIGKWARYGHIPALRLLPEYEITALVSRSRERAAQLAHQHEIPHCFDNVQDLVDFPEVDLVAVLPPAPQHAALVKQAFQAGKHVYCEWPLTTTKAASQELQAVAGMFGRRNVVGLQRTVGASGRYLKDLIAQGIVGRLRSVRMHVSVPSFGASRPPGLEWTVGAENFSNVLSIYGGHFMHMLFCAVGFPVTLNALLRTQFPHLTLAATGESYPNANPDGIVVQGALANDVLFQIQLEGGKHHAYGLEIDITGMDGDLRVRNDKAFTTEHENVIEVGKSGQLSWAEMPVPNSYRKIPESSLDVSVQDLAHLYRAFAQDKTSQVRSTPDFSDALTLHRIIDAIEQSSKSGISVRLENYSCI